MRKPARSKTRQGSGIAYLDSALWQRLQDAPNVQEFQRAWLGLQCMQISGVRRAVLVTRNKGPFRPTAFWPDHKSTSRFLIEMVEEALSKRVDQMREATDEVERAGLARLIRRDGEPIAVIAVELDPRPEREMQAALRQLQWGTGWLEAYQRRDAGRTDRQSIERLMLALDAIAIAGEHTSFRAAAVATLSELSVQLGAARISFGTRGRRSCSVRAVSNTTQFDRRVRTVRSIAEAMNEAADQATVVKAPADEADNDTVSGVVNLKAAALSAERDGGQVRAVPFVRDGRIAGVFVFEWTAEDPPEPHLLGAVDDVAALLGPVLADRYAEERWLTTKAVDVTLRHLGRLIGPGYLGRKITVSALVALVAFFAVYTTDFRVTADARLRGKIERVVVAPITGYVIEAEPQAGDRVRDGDVLVRIDDVEFQLERQSWIARKHQFETEYAQALADFDRAATNILRARMEEAEAQIQLNETRIALTRVRAPFDALVVKGDLSQQLGRSVQQGEELFRLTPFDDYRVEIRVHEGDVTHVRPGQVGRLVLSSLPTDSFEFTIETVTPVTGASEGYNYFVADAVLRNPGDRPLRPGMEGIAKIDSGDARLIWIWTRRLADWMRLTWWRWAP